MTSQSLSTSRSLMKGTPPPGPAPQVCQYPLMIRLGRVVLGDGVGLGATDGVGLGATEGVGLGAVEGLGLGFVLGCGDGGVPPGTQSAGTFGGSQVAIAVLAMRQVYKTP